MRSAVLVGTFIVLFVTFDFGGRLMDEFIVRYMTMSINSRQPSSPEFDDYSRPCRRVCLSLTISWRKLLQILDFLYDHAAIVGVRAP